MSSDPHDFLDSLMERRGIIPTSPDLQRDVWRRIALKENLESAGHGLRATTENWFSCWPFAALFITTCMLVGLLCAEIRHNQLDRERSIQLARSYMVMINPMLQDNQDP